MWLLAKPTCTSHGHFAPPTSSDMQLVTSASLFSRHSKKAHEYSTKQILDELSVLSLASEFNMKLLLERLSGTQDAAMSRFDYVRASAGPWRKRHEEPLLLRNG